MSQHTGDVEMACSFKEPYLNILLFIGLPEETKDRAEKDKEQCSGRSVWLKHNRVRIKHSIVKIMLRINVNKKAAKEVQIQMQMNREYRLAPELGKFLT